MQSQALIYKFVVIFNPLTLYLDNYSSNSSAALQQKQQLKVVVGINFKSSDF